MSVDGDPYCFTLREGLQDTHGEIVLHAAALFGTLGYTKTNIGEIAERVGMSPGNLYRYYRNKQAIGEEVVRCHLANAERMMEAAVAAETTPEARLRTLCTAGVGGLLDALRDNPRMVELADMICASDSGILSAHIAWHIDLFRRLLDEGVARGDWAIADTAAMGETVLDATRAFWMPPAVTQLDPERVPGRVQGILDALIAGWRV